MVLPPGKDLLAFVTGSGTASVSWASQGSSSFAPHPTLPAPLNSPQGAAEPGAPGPPTLEPPSGEAFLSHPVTQRPCPDLSVVGGWAGQVWGIVCRYSLTLGSWRDPEGHTLLCPHMHWPLLPYRPPSSLWLTPPHLRPWRHPMMPTNLAQGKWPGRAVGVLATTLPPQPKVTRSAEATEPWQGPSPR